MNFVERHNNQFASPWAIAGLTERFKELWVSGERTKRITELLSAEFGVKIKKNALIGKAHRMALPRHSGAYNEPGNAIEIAERRAQRRDYLRQWRSKKQKPPRHEWAKSPTIEDYAIPTPQRKTIYELGPHDCRWPVGDPQNGAFFFCGGTAQNGLPYCAGHCARAFEPRRSHAGIRTSGLQNVASQQRL